MTEHRIEQDFIGSLELPQTTLYGIQTARSLENFPYTGRHCHPAWIKAMGEVKLAAARCSHLQGAWVQDKVKFQAIEAACLELISGQLAEHIVVDPLQGGAGTSLNMNVNEVIANRALEKLGLKAGDYQRVSPLDDINYQQSTNDVCPSACKIALYRQIDALLPSLANVERVLRKRSQDFASIVKVGRTQFQDAVLTTLGLEFKAYAEVMARDLRRLKVVQEKCLEVNLGGTAIGSSVSASSDYVRSVVSELASVTGLPLRQNRDLIDGTQNLDSFAEVSGCLKTLCTSLLKMSTDLRFMSSGPQAGIGELVLPARQAGSSIMPGKVNPVILEGLAQVSLRILGHDVSIGFAVASGHLELNAYLPLIADCLLNDLDSLREALKVYDRFCLEGIQAQERRCQAQLSSSTALITAMVSRIGYDKACQLGIDAQAEGLSIKDKLIQTGLVSEAEVESFTSAAAVYADLADADRLKA